MAFTGVQFVGNGTPSSTQSAASAISAAMEDGSGYHELVVHGYSRTKKNTPNGKCIRSRHFRAGGYRWLMEYYPNGSLSEDPDSMAFYLYLDEEDHVELQVQCRFSFVDQFKGRYIVCAKRSRYFSSHASSWGCLYVQKGQEVERYLRSDSLVVRCDVKVTKDAHNGAASVPAPDMQGHLNGLLLSGEGADVTFEVNGETFAAHRCVLAARSSVFKAELFGPMVEGTTSNVIRIDGIEEQVFKLMLTFIYSDSVPDDIEEEDEQFAIWPHLLVAADRYDLRRLRLMCEVKLCRYINAVTVGHMVVLAERHYCRGLKEACLDFICYPTNLQELMVAGLLDHLLSSCPSVLKEIVVKLASLKLDVNIVGDTGAADQPFLAVPESDMHQHFSWLLQSEEGTDVTFAVGGGTLSAHRCVLAARSAVFRAQLFGQMEEDSNSTTDVIIRIDDMEAKTFRLLLAFIYSDFVPNMKEEEKNEDDDADVTWQHLLIAACRYGLQRLGMICEVNLCRYINATTVAVILVLAEQHHCGCLKEACLDFLYIPANLQEVMGAGGLDHLSRNRPSVLIDVIAKLALLKRRE